MQTSLATAFELQDQLVASIDKLNESVVAIDSIRLTRNPRYGMVPLEGQGSGVIIDSNGFIVTNNHVIDGASRVQIHLRDGRSFEGEVVGSDPATDVALIRVSSDTPLPAAAMGDSDALKVGQFALAIGNTLGLPGGSTASLGLIGALGRPLPWAEFIFEGLIQTDAAINPGNSGGPLADINGNVVGINTAMIPFAQGVGFAIPINAVKRVVQQIFEKGRVIRPWLGISGMSLNPQTSETLQPAGGYWSTGSGTVKRRTCIRSWFPGGRCDRPDWRHRSKADERSLARAVQIRSGNRCQGAVLQNGLQTRHFLATRGSARPSAKLSTSESRGISSLPSFLEGRTN